MQQKYPRMLYQRGDAAARSVTVHNETEEQHHRADGYLRLGDQPKAKAPPAAPAALPAAAKADGSEGNGGGTPKTEAASAAASAPTPTSQSAEAAAKRGRPPKAAKPKAK